MASRKNLVLASLVSLVMVLSFGIGLVPMLTVSPDQSAKAAPGAAEVAISVDGTTPVGASYSVPVGGEQGFTALRLVGGGVEALGGGAVEWSLASDGSAKLVSGANDAVATVQALAPGEAGLYVRTADGLVGVVDLTFYDMKAVPVAPVSSVTVTSPLAGSRIVVPAGATVVPLTLTSTTDNPDDVLFMRYVVNSVVSDVIYGATEPYPLVIPNLLSLTSPVTVSAMAFSEAQSNYVNSSDVTFTVVTEDVDGLGSNDPNGIPDDPFGTSLGPDDQWVSTVNNGTLNRTVGMTLLGNQPLKAIPLPSTGVVMTVADPNDATRWVRVTAPGGLVQAGQTGLLLVAIADTPAGLLGAEAANLAPEPGTVLDGGLYASVNVLIEENGTWSSLSDVSANPVVVEMGGLGVTANQSASFAVHPDTVAPGTDNAEIVVATGGAWEKVANGTFVDVGLMSAELDTLGVVAPYAFATSPNVATISNTTVGSSLNGTARAFSIGGDTVRIALENVTAGAIANVTFDGAQAVSGTVDNVGGALGVTVTVPAAAALAQTATSATVDVRVDVGSDFDSVPGGLTYVGPQVTSITPSAGGPGTSVTIQGAGFDMAPGTTVTVGGVPLTVNSVSVNGTSISARFGSTLPEAGSVDVVVTNANGYTGTGAGLFSNEPLGTPVLNDVTPSSVYAGTSYALNLTGSNFAANVAKQQSVSTQVYFTTGNAASPASDTPAASLDTVTDTLITAKTPASLPAGTYSVYVATLTYTVGGSAGAPLTSNLLPVQLVDPADAQVTISSVVPAEGPVQGGTAVTITGTGFPNVSPAVLALIQASDAAYLNYAVFFGANKASIVDITPTNITVTTPAGVQGGLVDVRVQNPQITAAGNFAIAADAFLYQQPQLTVSPLTAYTVTGPVGGPLSLFTPASKGYTVTNAGTGTLTWTASADVPWLTVASGGGSLPAGQSTVANVSVNGSVTSLLMGQHQGIVTFDDGDINTPAIQTQVLLTVGTSNQPVLAVSPSADLTSAGPGGGPFTPDSIEYTVSNTGGGTLNWTASADQDWVTVLPASGSLTNGQTSPAVVSINNAANSLSGGTHTATVTFSNGSTSVTRQVTLQVAAPVLSVEPQTEFASFGPQGGPFAPLSQSYAVYNTGSGNLIWDANLVYDETTPQWLTLVKDTDSVTVTINDAAGQLTGTAAGTTYTETLQFTGNGGTTSRTVSLTVYARASVDSVAPRNVAPPAGGLTVYLRGSNFQTGGGTTRVFFTNAAGVADPSVDAEGQVTVFDDNVLAVVTPAHAAGTFEAYVRTSVDTAGGTIAQNSNLVSFIFAEPTLVIDTVNPTEGPIEGGTQVTITGSNLPNVGGATKSKLLSATGTTLALSSATYNVFGTSSTVQMNLTLLRGAQADYQNGPASITGSFLFDPTQLQVTGFSPDDKLSLWYGKNVALNPIQPGKVNFVISGGTTSTFPPESTELTTFDNQITGGTHNPNTQVNPFPIGTITFQVLTTQSVNAAVTIYDLAMVDSNAATFPEFDAQDGSVDITASSAEIQIEDPTVNDSAQSISVDFSLFRPAGANLLTGPAVIEFLLDYDENVLSYGSVESSTNLGGWYGKRAQVVANDATNGVLTIRVEDLPSKANAEITTINPADGTTQENPFTLGTLTFGKKTGADLTTVQPLVVTGLTMLDKNGQPFPGGGGVGEVGTITVTEMPQVFFGANESTSVLSSTATQIVANTPAGDRRETVDVYVVDPSKPAPGNYGFKADSFTYLKPELAVTPATDFVTTASVGSTVFDPASAAYQVYNSGNGTLNWTASVDQTWVSVDTASGTITGTDTATVTVSINASEASQLEVGVHTATITFAGNGGTVTRQVTLTITGESLLRVEPLTGVEFAGVPGGPFQPESRAFNVYNDGGGSLSWTAAADVTWLDLSPTTGVNTGTVVVTLNSEANQLAIGTHTGTITFTSSGGTLTRSVTLTILPPGEPIIVVTPENGLASSGQEGGNSFLPSSQAYTVYNSGGGLLTYSAEADQTWVSVLNGSGQIIGGENTTVTAMIDPTAAAALAASTQPYTAILRFYDGNDQTQDATRTISLTVFDLTVTTPNGGEEFQRGQQVPITWTYTGPATNQSVRIELLGASGAVVDTISALETNAQGENTFNWTVPTTETLGRSFRIQVRSTADNRVLDASDNTFAIIEPVFEVLNPSPGEEVQTGQAFTIRWNYFEVGQTTKANETVDIYLYKGDQEVMQIGDNVPNNAFDENEGQANAFVWQVPANLTLDAGYRIVFKSSDGETVLGGMPLDGTGFELVKGGGNGIGAILAGLIAALLGLAGGGGGGGGGGPCFIATAAYGTPMAAQIDTLREFRDMYLLSNPLGMVAADAYYHISPAIADVVAKYPVIAALVRMVLVPVVLLAKMAVAMPIPSMVLAAFGTVMLALRRLRRSRGKA